MGEVVGIDSQKPHLTGPVICTHCNHEWQVVTPVGQVDSFECPKCKLFMGVIGAPVVPGEVWRCDCGSKLFYLTREGASCRGCGVISNDWVDA